MRRTVLVTGGAGFIGSHMAERLLARGDAVVILDNESTGLRRNIPPGAEYIQGDVTNPADVTCVFDLGIDAVLHIAGQASTIRSFDDPGMDLNTNVVGTLNVLQACLARGTPRLLYASSMTVYGQPEALPVSETQAPRPISYYGIGKYAAERYVLTTAARNDLNGKFRATAFRMFNVYGERQRLDNPYQGVMGIFIGNVLRGEPIVIHSDGEQSRDFVYVSDVVDAWLAALDNPAADGRVFNLGCGESLSMNRLADEILAARGRSRADYPVERGPERPGDQRHMTADIRRAREVLGWQPRVRLAEGLRRTLAWAEAEIVH